MKTVTIPSERDPLVLYINGKRYEYPAGKSVSVPDEVADVIYRLYRVDYEPPRTVDVVSGGVSVEGNVDVSEDITVGDDLTVTGDLTVNIASGKYLKTTTGGKVVGATITMPTAATEAKAGLVKMAAAVADLSTTPTAADINAILAALRAAGVMAEPVAEPAAEG